MNKKLVLCVVTALALVLVGTGYAYWTDTLNVTTKATTGDLDVTFVDLGAYAQYSNETQSGQWSIIDGIGDNGFVDSDFFQRDTNTYNDVFGNPDAREDYYNRAEGKNSVEFDAKLENSGTVLPEGYPDLPYGNSKGTIHGDTISIDVLNMYPGYAQAFRSDIINIGSIAAKLSAIDVSLDSVNGVNRSAEAKGMIGVALLVKDENPVEYGDFVKLASNFSDDEKFELGGVEFVRLSALEGADIDIEENMLLVPGQGKEQRADMFIGVAVDPDAEGVYTTGSVADMKDNDDSLSQDKGFTIDIKFGWDQFNVGNNPDTTNILELQN